MKKTTLLILLCTPLFCTAAPNFEETRDWINSKIDRYNHTWKLSSNSGNTYKWRQRELSIEECSITSIVKLTQNDKEGEDHYGSYESFLSFPTREIKTIETTVYRHDRPSYNSYPFIELTYNFNAGTFVFHNTRHDSHKSRESRYLKIFFNFKKEESNLENRMNKAISRLKELALNNPKCQKNKEVF